MNMLIKGTWSAIHKALKTSGLPSYTLAADSTYNPVVKGTKDLAMKKARVLFDMFNAAYMTPNQMPMGNDKEVKFLMMGCGGDPTQSDGTYAIFKDFGEKKPSVVWKFEKHANPHMEEFDTQSNMLESVWNSFLDHEWKYSFQDYSCGSGSYKFSGKKAKELIEKWNDDANFKLDEKGKTVVPPKTKTTIAKKKEPPVIAQALDSIMVEKPDIQLGAYQFSYETIDDVPDTFYKNAAAEISGIKNAKDAIGDFNVSVYLKLMEKEIGDLIAEQASKWFDPLDYAAKYAARRSALGYSGDFLGDDFDVIKLSQDQFVRRAQVFRKTMELCGEKAVMKAILEAYPKKKNGFLYPKRVLTIAWLFAIRERPVNVLGTEWVSGQLYQLYAQAENEKELSITARLHFPALNQADGYENISKVKDLCSITNLFANI